MSEQFSLGQFLTDAELERCSFMYRNGKRGPDFTREIVEPNIERINRVMKREFDPRYLGYAIEYVMMLAHGA